jgi:hypothetical protein
MTKKPVKKPTTKPIKRVAAPKKAPIQAPPTAKELRTAKKLKKQAAIVAAADAVKRPKTRVVRKITPKPDMKQDVASIRRPIDNVDAPHIECHLVVGDLSVPVDAADLAHTIGAANYGHGQGLIDQWPDTVWAALLSYLGLPAFPLDRATAEGPVRRLVQRLWYTACRGGYSQDSETLMAKRDEEKVEEYKVNFEKVKETVEAKVEHAKKAFSGVRKVSTYAGKKIKVLNKNHGARPGTKRAIGMDIVITSKTTDEALPQLTKAGCNASFIAFALAQGFIELV